MSQVSKSESTGFSAAEEHRKLVEPSVEAEKDEPRTEYEILRAYKKSETDESLRTRYLRYTDELIGKIENEGADYVVYLDKSGRPVSWFVDELWKDFAGSKPKPGTKFV